MLADEDFPERVEKWIYRLMALGALLVLWHFW